MTKKKKNFTVLKMTTRELTHSLVIVTNIVENNGHVILEYKFAKSVFNVVSRWFEVYPKNVDASHCYRPFLSVSSCMHHRWSRTLKIISHIDFHDDFTSKYVTTKFFSKLTFYFCFNHTGII